MYTVAQNESQHGAFVSSISRLGSQLSGNQLAESQNGNLISDTELSIILFEVGGSLFALPTMSVLEVVRGGAIVGIPRAPEFIEGIIEIREQVIPVVDLRKKLGHPVRHTKDAIIIVAMVGGTKTGFIVDSARKVLSLAAEDMQDLGPILSGPERRYVFRTISRNNEPVVILNIDTILNENEVTSLADVGRKAA